MKKMFSFKYKIPVSVNLKALVLVNHLNTSIHDCSFNNVQFKIIS